MLGTIAFILIAALIMGLANPIHEWMEKNKFDRDMNKLLNSLPKPEKKKD